MSCPYIVATLRARPLHEIIRRCRNACEKSLKDLGVDTIDLYYQHRTDPKTPIEDSVKAMAVVPPVHALMHCGICSSRQPPWSLGEGSSARREHSGPAQAALWYVCFGSKHVDCTTL
jgi:Aldo/keto reductase family